MRPKSKNKDKMLFITSIFSDLILYYYHSNFFASEPFFIEEIEENRYIKSESDPNIRKRSTKINHEDLNYLTVHI